METIKLICCILCGILWCLMFSDYLVCLPATKKTLKEAGKFSEPAYYIGIAFGVILRFTLLLLMVLIFAQVI